MQLQPTTVGDENKTKQKTKKKQRGGNKVPMLMDAKTCRKREEWGGSIKSKGKWQNLNERKPKAPKGWNEKKKGKPPRANQTNGRSDA